MPCTHKSATLLVTLSRIRVREFGEQLGSLILNVGLVNDSSAVGLIMGRSRDLLLGVCHFDDKKEAVTDIQQKREECMDVRICRRASFPCCLCDFTLG